MKPCSNMEKEVFGSEKLQDVLCKRTCPCENTDATVQGTEETEQTENTYGKRILGFYSSLFTAVTLMLFV